MSPHPRVLVEALLQQRQQGVYLGHDDANKVAMQKHAMHVAQFAVQLKQGTIHCLIVQQGGVSIEPYWSQ